MQNIAHHKSRTMQPQNIYLEFIPYTIRDRSMEFLNGYEVHCTVDFSSV